MNNFSRLILAVAAAGMLVTGCARQKGPANEALEKIESSLAEVKEDAARYAPDGLKGVEAQLERLKQSYEAKDYENVLAGTPQLEKAVGSLKEAVSSGKEHARAAIAVAKSEWEGLSADVQKTIDSLQARVDALSNSRRLPRGLSKDEFEGAKAAFEAMKAQWAEATAEFKDGDAVEAASKGRTVKGMGDELVERLDVKTT
jgi:predicted  nucleic acid-binding Zn-ribbon protein